MCLGAGLGKLTWSVAPLPRPPTPGINNFQESHSFFCQDAKVVPSLQANRRTVNVLGSKGLLCEGLHQLAKAYVISMAVGPSKASMTKNSTQKL